MCIHKETETGMNFLLQYLALYLVSDLLTTLDQNYFEKDKIKSQASSDTIPKLLKGV